MAGPFGLLDRYVMVQPNTARTHLVAVGMGDGAAVHHWNVPLIGEIRTNLSASSTPGGGMALGVGTSGNRLGCHTKMGTRQSQFSTVPFEKLQRSSNVRR